MDTKDKITELLGRQNLTTEEKQELQTLIANDEELNKFAALYRQLSATVSHSSHLSEEEISEYILYQNGMTADKESIIKRIPFIKTHLRHCTNCSEIFREMNSEYSNIDSFVSGVIVQDRKIPDKALSFSTTASGRRHNTPRFAFVSVLIIAFIYISLYFISSFSTPAYYDDAGIKDKSEFSINRGRASEYFQNSLKALEKNDYDNAIDYLKKDIRQNPDDETIFYSYYIMGILYLETAEHSFLGLFPGYNSERAEKGREYLKESIQKNNSDKFNNIRLNSYFYLSKASLMLNDRKSARAYLKIVIQEKGGKMDEAKKLLGELE